MPPAPRCGSPPRSPRAPTRPCPDRSNDRRFLYMIIRSRRRLLMPLKRPCCRDQATVKLRGNMSFASDRMGGGKRRMLLCDGSSERCRLQKRQPLFAIRSPSSKQTSSRRRSLSRVVLRRGMARDRPSPLLRSAAMPISRMGGARAGLVGSSVCRVLAVHELFVKYLVGCKARTLIARAGWRICRQGEKTKSSDAGTREMTLHRSN